MELSPSFITRLRPFQISLLWLLFFLVIAFLSGCGDADSIRIGFTGPLTGQYSDIGVSGRSGAEFAVEQLNDQGGIAGRKLKLIVENDGGTPEQALVADRNLISQDVVAIIGHMTSGPTMAALQLTEQAKMVMISPTTATSDLDGKKDLFFRLNISTTRAAAGLAKYVASLGNIHSVNVLYDADNLAYTLRYVEDFQKTFQALGGHIGQTTRFSAQNGTPWTKVLNMVDWNKSEAVLLVASSRDTGGIAQGLRHKGYGKHLLATGWGGSTSLIQFGGMAVEDMVFDDVFDEQATTPAFMAFNQAFQKRFGREPNGFAALSYETVLFLAKALEKTGGQPKGLESALLGINDFHGLVEPLRLDEFGDVDRCTVISMVQNGTKVTLGCVKTH